MTTYYLVQSGVISGFTVSEYLSQSYESAQTFMVEWLLDFMKQLPQPLAETSPEYVSETYNEAKKFAERLKNEIITASYEVQLDLCEPEDATPSKMVFYKSPDSDLWSTDPEHCSGAVFVSITRFENGLLKNKISHP